MARAKAWPDDQDVKSTTKISGRRGSLIWHPWKGRLVVQAKPRYTATTSRRALERWIAWLRVQNVLYQVTSARIRAQLLEWEKLSGIPARDWFMSSARGHTFSFDLHGAGEVFSVATRDRYSRSLDVFGQKLGDILVRGIDTWESLSVGTEGDFLVVKDGRPAWAASAAAGSNALYFGAESIYAWSTVVSTLFSYHRSIRLPYATTGAGIVTVVGVSPLPGRTVAAYYWPVSSSGTARHYFEVWAIASSGEPVGLGRTYDDVTFVDGFSHWFSREFQIPSLPSGSIGFTLAAGREGASAVDTAPDYTYLLSLTFYPA